MRTRISLLRFIPWRQLCGHVVGAVSRHRPNLGYALGYHCGLAFSMMDWAAENHAWEAYRAVRNEIQRRGYALPHDCRMGAASRDDRLGA